ncbi:hypothetical protein [Polaromonas jejuensis]|uniref:hypothetical protein n=1 Tax=Polaromonas jejuensis TaxID=457502 RepID=UPI0012ED7BD7|nr:hypothetical protein [Polaromonas jejuensis]
MSWRFLPAKDGLARCPDSAPGQRHAPASVDTGLRLQELSLLHVDNFVDDAMDKSAKQGRTGLALGCLRFKRNPEELRKFRQETFAPLGTHSPAVMKHGLRLRLTIRIHSRFTGEIDLQPMHFGRMMLLNP